MVSEWKVVLAEDGARLWEAQELEVKVLGAGAKGLELRVMRRGQAEGIAAAAGLGRLGRLRRS